MVDIKNLNSGDRVRIVSKWYNGCCENLGGLMDKYLGTVMTVDKIIHGLVYMLEDNGEWAWNGKCISEKIEEDYNPATSDEMLEFLTSEN